MATRQITAQISKRDLWIAAAELDMRDASEQEVGKVCYLISACGWTPEAAKAEVKALRRKPDTSNAKKIFGLNVPTEWTNQVRKDLASLSNSELVRYILAYIVDEDHDTALDNSKRKRGPKPRTTPPE